MIDAWAIVAFVFLGAILLTPLGAYIKVTPLPAAQLLLIAGIAFVVAIFWQEAVKMLRYGSPIRTRKTLTKRPTPEKKL